ncbi:hypothetical protein BGZ81_010436 [Podila clonocystis]|nr:hypothetical protein BGZ81_010436 [Podila clonocystis]
MPRSRADSFLESNCIPDLWRLRLGQSVEWNITNSAWEPVQPKETATLPPVAGLGLKTLLVPGNHTAHITNGTVAHADNTSPFMIEFGRSGCADEETEGGPVSTSGLSGIAFNIYNPVLNTWQVTDLVNISDALAPPLTSELNANLTRIGNWLSPVVAVDYVKLAWYIVLQSTVPLRQLILKKDVSELTLFMSKVDLKESSSTLFPDDLLFEGWETVSDLNETAPFVGRGVATMMRDSIVIISGTANSFTPGDANIAELRGCDHAYLFSTVDHTWKRQELSVANDGVFPETREKAAFIAGSNVGRNTPIVGVLPIMAYNTNSSAWTNTIRATLDMETTFISNVTRAAIIIGTVVFASVLVVIALSTHLLRKWNQRNYTKMDESFQLEQQKRRRNGTPELPSILKKRYLAEGQDGGRKARATRRVRGLQAEVIFERAEYSDEDDNEDEEEEEEEEEDGFGADDEGDHEVQKVSLLSRAQPAPNSRGLSRQRVEEEEYADDVEEDETEEDEEEDGQVIVRLPREE